MRKIFLFIFLMALFITNVNAEACDAYDIKRLKEIANGVEITYELQEPTENNGLKVMDTYKLNISGLTSDLILYNETDDLNYTFNLDLSNILVSSGIKKFEVYGTYCSNVLKKIEVKLPVFNNYSDSDFCKEDDNKLLDVCKQWVDKKISENEFYYVVNKDEMEDVSDNKNIIILLVVVIIVILMFIIGFSKKKRNDLI